MSYKLVRFPRMHRCISLSRLTNAGKINGRPLFQDVSFQFCPWMPPVCLNICVKVQLLFCRLWGGSEQPGLRQVNTYSYFIRDKVPESRAGPAEGRAGPPRRTWTHHKPGVRSHRSVCFESRRWGSEANPKVLRLSCIINAAEFDDLFNRRSSAASPLLCSGISHTALMSHYFPHRSASDKRLRQAVKNRSKPPGWEEEEEEEGADRQLSPPPLDRLQKMPPIIR